MRIVSVPEYGFSVNLNQMASVRAEHNDSYNPPWVIEICYVNDTDVFLPLRKFDTEEDMNKAFNLFVERLPDDFNI